MVADESRDTNDEATEAASLIRLHCQTAAAGDAVMWAMKTHALPPQLADARPKRLRFSVFTIPARIVSHARRLLVRVAEAWCKACELLAWRRRRYALWAEQHRAARALPRPPAAPA